MFDWILFYLVIANLQLDVWQGSQYASKKIPRQIDVAHLQLSGQSQKYCRIVDMELLIVLWAGNVLTLIKVWENLQSNNYNIKAPFLQKLDEN